MKPVNQFCTFLFAMLLAAVLSFVGCSSTGIQRSEKATSTMQTMDNDINLLVVQLDATGVSLDELTKPGQSNIGKAYDLYKDNVLKMEAMDKQFAKHNEEMKTRGKEYFEEWQKDGSQYKNPQIQKLSDERRAELGDIYGKIAENSVGVQGAIDAYLSDAKEVQNYLSNDLTPKGIEAIHPSSQKVVDDGQNLKSAIKNIQTAIDKARSEMSQDGK
jgi:hypothetical protein